MHESHKTVLEISQGSRVASHRSVTLLSGKSETSRVSHDSVRVINSFEAATGARSRTGAGAWRLCPGIGGIRYGGLLQPRVVLAARLLTLKTRKVILKPRVAVIFPRRTWAGAIRATFSGDRTHEVVRCVHKGGRGFLSCVRRCFQFCSFLSKTYGSRFRYPLNRRDPLFSATIVVRDSERFEGGNFLHPGTMMLILRR